ncbi:MAG: FtsX-like permease family protein, partial [Burkholderiales bacterium]|nr:FtsX-like permease family protein [Burkholderiales bacterium]
MRPLLASFSWQELRHHPWRNAAAVVSVMLGVALAFSVHLINASALDEFSQAVRSVGGQPDLELRFPAAAQPAPEAPPALSMLARLQHHPDVAVASAVLELSTYARGTAAAAPRTLLRIVGVDALQVASVAPDLMPWPDGEAGRLDLFAPDAVFLNAAARRAFGDGPLQLQQGLHLKAVRVAGSVHATGPALAVMDIAAVQDLFDRPAQISRIDVRLRSGVDRGAWARALQAAPDWPAGATLAAPGDAAQRLGKLSRAYRVNLTVLALVALFTGGFVVFSVLALSVTRRAQQFALLGVLGLTRTQRMQLVLWEAAALGAVGSALGIGLGTALAAVALQLLGGDLGGGYFAASTPALQWSGGAAAVFAALGVAASLVGAWWPAQLARTLAPAQTLKGLGALDAPASHPWLGVALVAGGALMALVPPLWDIPIAA